jgi:hypothetical protein
MTLNETLTATYTVVNEEENVTIVSIEERENI